MLNSLDILGSAITAERLRTEVITQNITNQNTTRTANGEGPYLRKNVIFETRELTFNDALTASKGGGVRVKEIVENPNALNPVYDPTHPDADEDGYVMYPNVNNADEQIDLMAASRSLESQIAALSVIKSIAAKTLTIGQAQ
ncbi:MAG: flagellar basal body rod protein FlgC [Oscillospiraceae bacterium]|jgi:flagellar basal-body rod protein FlgC|nr:flagellar basal body rod protein FlgC [Oscillospiraceae bacterium]